MPLYVDGYVLPVPRRNMPRFAKMPKKMPFDPKRMVYGGFKVIVDA